MNEIKNYVTMNYSGEDILRLFYEKGIKEVMSDLENCNINLKEDTELDMIRLIYSKAIFDLEFCGMYSEEEAIKKADELCKDTTIEDILKNSKTDSNRDILIAIVNDIINGIISYCK